MSAAPAIRTLIVDDEPLARRRHRALLSTEPGVEIVGEAGSGPAAVAAVREKRPDLVLLDIQMPGKDGFEVLEEIAGQHDPAVVFVTAHDEHAIRAFEVQAVDYVLKPVVEERVRAAVRRAIARLRAAERGDLADSLAKLLERVRSTRAAARLPIKTDRGVALVPAAEIQWVEADGDLARVHATRGTHLVRTTMADLESRLPARQFSRVHRSAIVNVDCIQEIQPLFKGDYVILLKNGARVRSGRAYRARVQALMKG